MTFKATERPRKQGQSDANIEQSGKGDRLPAANIKQSGKGDRLPDEPSPWLETDPNHSHAPHATASFVEYLRWMRSPSLSSDDNSKREDNETKLLLLQLAQERADYRDRLAKLTERTKKIAGTDGITFRVVSPWRIRVGGHRGPESILLPAFDAAGMPYIPSATLRGIARNQAIREFLPQVKGDGKQAWKQAEKLVYPYFGSLEAEKGDRAGKVIFLDAYPDPDSCPNGGLAVDMANNLWTWDKNLPAYKANPNLFFSLEKPAFVIGLRPRTPQDGEAMLKVQTWLLAGLKAGAGSQINTGYGRLTGSGEIDRSRQFLSLKFKVEGQLIHSHPTFKDSDRPYGYNKKGQLTANTVQVAEVRPVAFKSLLRYWFRTIALGVLPGDRVKELEAMLLGAINPQKLGWVQVQIAGATLERAAALSAKDEFGVQAGELVLSYSSEAPPRTPELDIAQLMEHLTWLIFHLGGIGQGARRPCYSRQHRQPSEKPYWRGSTLIPLRETVIFNEESHSWSLPKSLKHFASVFQERLQGFYEGLRQLQNFYVATTKERSIAFNRNRPTKRVTERDWVEAIDKNCCILVCEGASSNGKPFALATLHHPEFKIREKYDVNLCGSTNRPSPVWISEILDEEESLYQVVTVFGATSDPRRQYVDKLKEAKQNCAEISL